MRPGALILSLLGPLLVAGAAAAQYDPSPLTFCGAGQYAEHYVGVRHPEAFVQESCAVAVRGQAGSAGDTWITRGVVPFELDEGVCLRLDVLFESFNNAKGAGVIVGLPAEGISGLFVHLVNAGRSDRLRLSAMDPTGALRMLTELPLLAPIDEHRWYRINARAVLIGDHISVQAYVLAHVDPFDPRSETIVPLSTLLIYLGPRHDVADVGYAGLGVWGRLTRVDSRLTNPIAIECAP